MRGNGAIVCEQRICEEWPAPQGERAEGPQRCLWSCRSWVGRSRRLRRMLRGKLNGVNSANNGTRGQRALFLRTTLVISMRLEHLLVGDGRANPVPKNRRAGGGRGLQRTR